MKFRVRRENLKKTIPKKKSGKIFSPDFPDFLTPSYRWWSMDTAGKPNFIDCPDFLAAPCKCMRNDTVRNGCPCKTKFSENSFMIWPLIIERAVVFQEPLDQRRLLNLIVYFSLFINLIYERYVTRLSTIVEILKILFQNFY